MVGHTRASCILSTFLNHCDRGQREALKRYAMCPRGKEEEPMRRGYGPSRVSKQLPSKSALGPGPPRPQHPGVEGVVSIPRAAGRGPHPLPWAQRVFWCIQEDAEPHTSPSRKTAPSQWDSFSPVGLSTKPKGSALENIPPGSTPAARTSIC